MDRLAIPEEIKRQLRQEAGFGCCFCGFPFCDYHHINPWARKNEHDPNDLMYVCPNHHRECGQDAYSEDEQRSVKSTPANVQAGLTYGHLHIGSSPLHIHIGSNNIVSTPIIFASSNNRAAYLRCEKNEFDILELTMELRAPDGTLVGAIEKNDWIFGVDAIWDLQAQSKKIKCNLASRRVLLNLDASRSPIVLTGNWKFGSSSVSATPSQLKVDGLELSGNHSDHCHTAFSI